MNVDGPIIHSGRYVGGTHDYHTAQHIWRDRQLQAAREKRRSYFLPSRSSYSTRPLSWYVSSPRYIRCSHPPSLSSRATTARRSPNSHSTRRVTLFVARQVRVQLQSGIACGFSPSLSFSVGHISLTHFPLHLVVTEHECTGCGLVLLFDGDVPNRGTE